MKRFLAIGSVLAALTLSACATKEEPQSKTTDEVPELVEVDLNVPETASANVEVIFTAAVTQGEEIVEDADEVKFEVKNINTGEKELLEAHLNEKQYEGKYKFTTKGTYDVTSHVTARDMHTMPTKQIVISAGEE
ncbi:MAG: FixH family protein [Paenisporosarcina sp.]|nr:FixH family protein [Paenisporosarcina sp.]